MVGKLIDEGKHYSITRINWVRIKGGDLTVNYIGDDKEIHEVSGPIPEYVRISNETSEEEK